MRLTTTRAIVSVLSTGAASVALGAALVGPAHSPAPLTAAERAERTATHFPALARWACDGTSEPLRAP